MDFLTAVILGIVQGATEFLPVSSSGHLVIVSRALGVPSSFSFDVLVNFGTLLAMVIYFRGRIWQILRDITVQRRIDTAVKIGVATIPAVLVGFFFQSVIEQHLHNVWIVIVMLVAVGLLMIISRTWQPKQLPSNKDVRDIKTRHALLIGLAQCFSLISGSSRSGVTMLASLKLGFTKEKAAEWSFLMGIPIIFGASLKVLLSEAGMEYVQQHTSHFLIANLASFVSGMIAVSLLMRILQKYGLYFFGWYRIALAAVLIVLISVNIV